jgi:hypothetical protein
MARDKRKDLPAESDINSKRSDTQNKHQEEYDNEKLGNSQRMQSVSKSKGKHVTGHRGRDMHPET